MSDQAKCCKCGNAVSYETGFSITGTLAEGSQDSIHCPDCAPEQGKGYTLSDLEKWREENQVHRARYQQSQMDLVGPEVYFHVTGPTFPPDDNLT